MTRSILRRSYAVAVLVLGLVCIVGRVAHDVPRALADPQSEDLFGNGPAAPAQLDRPKPVPARGGAVAAAVSETRTERPRFASREASESEKRITAALKQPTNLEFTETSVGDAIGFLSDQHQIPIVLDKKSFEDAGLAIDVPVTINVKGVSLRSGLDLALSTHNLAYFITDEVLLITTQDAAERMTEVRVYKVADLAKDEGDLDRLASLVNQMFDANVAASPRAVARGVRIGGGSRFSVPAAGGGGSRFSVGGGGRFGGAAPPAPPAAPVEPPRELAADANPAVIAPYRDLLLVRASQRTHEEIGRFLDEMRRELKD